MLIACNVKPTMKKIPAVVHVDNSCRVQTVTYESNMEFYLLIKRVLQDYKMSCSFKYKF